ncbi:MAG TPA: hypothetical protein VK445_06205, partial [Dissulfurispiraceae bacterium]|nr:hypothetical protein [Dissulfurispiraceae bacterium]
MSSLPFISDPVSRSSAVRILIVAVWAGLLVLPFTGLIKALFIFGGMLLAGAIWSTIRALRLPALGSPVSFDFLSRHELPISMSAITVCALLPLALGDYAVDVLILCGIYIILAIGLNIIVGFAGLLNLGFAAFYAIGAYAYALLNTNFGLGFWACLPVAAAAAALAGLLVAIPSLRLKGDYLAIVTLGFGEIVRLTLNNWDALTHGPNGITNIARPFFFSAPLDSLQSFYYVVLFFVVLAVLVMRRIKYSGAGRAWIAIRENELAASAS